MSDDRSRTKMLAPIARHGRQRRRNPIGALFKLLAGTLAVLLISSVAVGAVALSQIEGSIDTIELVGQEEGAPPPDIGSFEGGFNVLLVGSDRCEDSSGCAGRGSANLNDVTILVHVSQDQTNAVAVSFPRDLVVPIPSCPREDGKGNNGAMSGQPINVTLFYGGLPCTVLTVEKLTGLDIPFAGLITFNGVVNMSTAIGGVTVCTTGPVVDRYSGINLPAAGEWPLHGDDALAFLRSRHGVGDGSDLGRISSQQVFMSAMARQLTSDGVLKDPVKLYNLATTATRSMQLSTSMKNVTTLASMARVFANMDLANVQFVQYPSTTGVGGIYLGKVAPIERKAEELFQLIRADLPFSLPENSTGRGSVVNPDAPAVTPETPEGEAAAPPIETQVLSGVQGQSAADHTCSKANN
jgi:LCP family protein required for cell wall assembly